MSICSASSTDFLPIGCSGGTDTTERTASETDVDVDVDSGADAGIPETSV